MRRSVQLITATALALWGCSDADPAGSGGAVDVATADQGRGVDPDVADGGSGGDADGTVTGDSSPLQETAAETIDGDDAASLEDMGEAPDDTVHEDSEEDDSGSDGGEPEDADPQSPDEGDPFPEDVETEPGDVGPGDDADPALPPEPGPNPMYEVGDDCVTPKDYVTPPCEDVVCPGGTICMGFGYCVPDGPFLMDPDDPGARQVKPALALAPDGGYAASWYDVLYPPDVPEKSMDIGFRLFAADGTPTTDIVKLDEDALAWARSPSMTRMQDGGYLVVWRAQTSTTGELRFLGRVVNAEGVPQGSAFQLNDTVLDQGFAGGNVDSPVPTLLRSGDIAVTWMGTPVDNPGNKTDVYLRVLSPTGDFKTGELLTGAESTANESASVVTDTFEGGVAIFWGHNELSEPGSYIRGRVFDKDAQPVTDVFQASPGDDPQELMPAATTFPGGEILLTWKSKPDGTPAVHTMSTYLGPWGEDLGAVIHHVGTDPAGYYPFYSPTDEADPDRAAVAWHTIDQNLDGAYLRRYYPLEDLYDCETTDLSGALMPTETGTRHLPAVLGFPDGRILVVWSSSFNNGQNITRAVLRYVK